MMVEGRDTKGEVRRKRYKKKITIYDGRRERHERRGTKKEIQKEDYHL
jgi:hypothetical protein